MDNVMENTTNSFMNNQTPTWNYMVDVLRGAVSSATQAVGNDAACMYTEVFFLPNNFIKGSKRYAAKSNSEGPENAKI